MPVAVSLADGKSSDMAAVPCESQTRSISVVSRLPAIVSTIICTSWGFAPPNNATLSCIQLQGQRIRRLNHKPKMKTRRSTIPHHTDLFWAFLDYFFNGAQMQNTAKGTYNSVLFEVRHSMNKLAFTVKIQYVVHPPQHDVQTWQRTMLFRRKVAALRASAGNRTWPLSHIWQVLGGGWKRTRCAL